MLAAAAITLVVPALAVAGPAKAQPAAPAASGPPIAANSVGWICNPNNAKEDCWGPDQSGTIGNGTQIRDGFDTGHAVNEVFVEPDSGSCNGGEVSSNCPFVVGAGLNNDLINHTIVTLNYSADGNFCADSDGADIVFSNCTGSHAAYVIVDGGKALVSVGASNAFESEAGPNNPELAFDTPGGGGTRNPVGSLDQADLQNGDVTFDDTWVETGS